MTEPEVPLRGPALKAFILAACVRCDRKALGRAMKAVSPAMAAGVTGRLFDVSDLVALLVESECKKAA